jgi:hypothetical protein
VNTTEHIAKTASTPEAGLFATLRGLRYAQGTVALAFVVCLTVAVLALSAGVARAEPPKLVPAGEFKAEGPFGVAVDQAGGDVYVANFLRFTPGSPEGPYQLPKHNEKFDAAGKLLLDFGEEGLYSGAAVNATNGGVYVLNSGSPEIDTFDPGTGAPVGTPFPVPPSGNSLNGVTAVQIAADSAGDVYVPVALSNEVLEYPPTGEPREPINTFTGGSGTGALKGPTGVAVDSAGNVWVADTGNNRIEELNPAGTPIGEIHSDGVQAVAPDEHGHVLAILYNSADPCGSRLSPCDHLVEYDSAGAQLADIGAGQFGPSAAEDVKVSLSTLAVNATSGRVYVTDDAHGLVLMYAPPTAPQVKSELAVEVGSSSTKLGALVNPAGLDASYRFEYGPTTAYGHSVPFPEGDTGTGFDPRTVWAAASGLAPASTYHYRVVVTSELGEVPGTDQTFTTSTAAQAECPNEQLRTGFSANLPDCRAYELVTPPNDTSAQTDPADMVPSMLTDNFAANDGNRMAFNAEDVFPGSRSAGQRYLATRGSGGWSSENDFPPENYYGYQCPNKNNHVERYSASLTRVLLAIGTSENSDECGGPEPELVKGEPKGIANLYLRDSTDGAFQLIGVAPPGVTPGTPTFLGASADFSHIVFGEEAKLTSNALDGVENVYEWSEGVERLLTVLPDGTAVAGSFAGISTDGSHIFFVAGGGLYARVEGSSTVLLDASQVGGSGGGGSFCGASAAGSRVLFTDHVKLTADSTAEAGKPDLYRYDFSAPEGERIRDLTVDGGEAANVGGVLGVSGDGSHVYFEAQGVLTGSQANQHGETAQSGQPNLYLWHDRTTTFITRSDGNAHVSKNGAFLAFDSTVGLTGYDNTDATTGKPDAEIYLYDAASNSIACASCNPSGAPPTEPTGLEGRPSNPLSENGRVFFNSSVALLPADTNGQQDVYEFEPGGAGSCGDPAGCVLLISTGTGSRATSFIDASASGDDVFLREYQKLVRQDTQEESATIYDARAGGGLPEPAAPPACTTTDACRTAPTPQPLFPSAGVGTAAVFGEDNLGALPPPVVKPKTLTNAQKRAKAIATCKKHFSHNKKKRHACEKAAHQKYRAKRANQTNRRAK